MTKFEVNGINFEMMECGKCGCLFCVNQHFVDERRMDGGTWYCPNGHPRVFKESFLDRANREHREREQRLQAQINEERHARLVAERAAEKERRARRKVEKRVAAGVCPCCNRTFEDLQRHMKTKHKDYAALPKPAKQIESTVQ